MIPQADARTDLPHQHEKKRIKGDGENDIEIQDAAAEKEFDQKREDGLCLFLQHWGLTSQSLSELGQQKDSFGMAWMSMCMMESYGNLVAPPRAVELSGSSGLSAQKISLLLSRLPPSVVEMTIDSAVVRGPGLPLFLRFLQRLRVAREEGKEAPRLTSFTFKSNSLGHMGPPWIFPLLLPSLEILCLKGNPLGFEGLKALAECIKKGSASSLLYLDLEGCGLSRRHVVALSQAIEACPLLSLETLILSKNEFADSGLRVLCQTALSVEALPRLRVLLLKQCDVERWGFKRLCEDVLAKGCLPSLEILDLEGNVIESKFLLRTLSPSLRADAVPSLKKLYLNQDKPKQRLIIPTAHLPDAVEVFLNALSADERPPQLHHVSLRLDAVSAEQARSLGTAGKYPSIKTLSLSLGQGGSLPFLRGIVDSPPLVSVSAPPSFSVSVSSASSVSVSEPPAGNPSFEVLDLDLDLGNTLNEGLALVGRGIRMGRFTSLRRLNFEGGLEQEESWDEGKRAFFSALQIENLCLPLLTHLAMPWLSLSDDEVGILSKAAQSGQLPALQSLNLECNFSLTSGTCMHLIDLVKKTDRGLEELKLEGSSAGQGFVVFLYEHDVDSWASDIVPFRTRMKNFQNLSTLNLSNSDMDTDALEGFALAVHEGLFRGLSDLDLSSNPGPSSQAWEGFMTRVAESAEGGLRKLKVLNLLETNAAEGGGAVVRALSSGNLESLENLQCDALKFDQQAVDILGEALREGRLPPSLRLHSRPPWTLVAGEGGERVNLDPLVQGISESPQGRLCPHIAPSSVALSGGRISPAGVAALAAGYRAGKVAGDVDEVSLCDTALTDRAMAKLGFAVERGDLCGISALRLNDNPEVGKKGVEDLMVGVVNAEGEVGGGLPKLKTFCLLRCGKSVVEGGKSVVGAVSSGKFPKLENLLLQGLCAEGVHVLGQSVRDGKLPKKMKQLLIGQQKEEGEGGESSLAGGSASGSPSLDELMEGIEGSEDGLPNLMYLTLAKAGQLSYFGVLSLATSLGAGKLPDLQTLCLDGCGVNDEGLKALAIGFRINVCESLESIHLNENALTVGGVTTFVDTIRRGSLPELSNFFLKRQKGCEGEEAQTAFSEAIRALEQRAWSEGKLLLTTFITEPPPAALEPPA
uniref:Uncharacterized protein n=1 Tax=Chromera velia CCMP2878 TaxID=1169474 RepID=A0A0G4FWP9_9ALVE|eukprot:Cvel_19125.t1-p1 / transcript=Cvel_19125.t1 / gene=Cvel_19125 / organism=Chromera_velia_CCMP2878 / gene_product=hypothetical protein / transcript_product=hypothetical protein / location=Cvel_scaffold1625:14441-20882(+) / protein_length=1147 / sequence_SO=supercontig / SO=protein_coding / is_pseudo=false